MTTADEADKKARLERARETGLFRYSLVQELLEPGLSLAERGWRAREMAARVHEGPGGRRVTVSYSTLTRWRRRYEEGGFDALVPSPRQPSPRTPEEVLALAEALKREKPGRTAAQVRRILQVTSGWAPSDRTLQRLFERLELNRPAGAALDAADLQSLVETFKGIVKARPAGNSRRTPRSSWTWPSRPCSTPGTRPAPTSTAARSASRPTWAPP